MKVPVAEKVTPLAVAEMLYVPTVPTVTLIVCVTPLTATPAVNVPAEVVVQELKEEITEVPFEEGKTQGPHTGRPLHAVKF